MRSLTKRVLNCGKLLYGEHIWTWSKDYFKLYKNVIKRHRPLDFFSLTSCCVSRRNWLDFTVVLFSFMELLAASIPGSSTATWSDKQFALNSTASASSINVQFDVSSCFCSNKTQFFFSCFMIWINHIYSLASILVSHRFFCFMYFGTGPKVRFIYFDMVPATPWNCFCTQKLRFS